MRIWKALAAGALAGAWLDAVAIGDMQRQHMPLARHSWLPGSSLAAHAAWGWLLFTAIATLFIASGAALTRRGEWSPARRRR